MNVELSDDLQTLVESLVASGRFSSVDEVVNEGVRLLASQEQLRLQVEAAIQQADRGEVAGHSTVFSSLRSMVAATHETRSTR